MPPFDQFRVFSPEANIGGGVARRAESNQILQTVGLAIVGEETEGLEVVNRQMVSLLPAVLASIAVTLSGFLPLLVPILAAIGRVPAFPRRIVRSRVTSRFQIGK